MRLMPSLQRLFQQHGLIGLSLCGSQELQPWECARLENGIRLTHGVATMPYLSRQSSPAVSSLARRVVVTWPVQFL